MYLVPQHYKCPKCEYECKYSEQDGWTIPTFKAGPVCPKCWGEFVLEFVPIMELAVLKEIKANIEETKNAVPN